MKKISMYLFFLCLPTVFISCQETCNCTKNLGCTVIIATGNIDGAIKERKSYCSDVNYYPDQARLDSVNSFNFRHTSDDTRIETKDSIYYTQTTKKIKLKDTKHYEDLGYSCDCFK